MDDLFKAAKAAWTNAYAVYSRFSVGAALQAENGSVFAGCNVENAAYPVGLCAEAGAIAAMIAGGERHISALLVFSESLAMPCGSCRQLISEFAGRETVVHIAGPDGIQKSVIFDTLLPFAFKPDTLLKPR